MRARRATLFRCDRKLKILNRYRFLKDNRISGEAGNTAILQKYHLEVKKHYFRSVAQWIVLSPLTTNGA